MLVFGLVACRGDGETDDPADPDDITANGTDEQENTLRIGALFSTGPGALAGQDQLDAAMLFLDERDHKIGLYDVEFLVESDEESAETALTHARRFMDEDVHLLFGAHRTDVGLALADFAVANGIPYLIPGVGAEDLTQRRANDLLLRTGGSNAQANHPFGRWAFDQGYRRIATMGVDNTFGYEGTAGFVRTFEEAGGQVVIQLWTPADTAEYRPFLGQIPAGTDAIYINYYGMDAYRALEAIAELDLGITVFAGGLTVDEHILARMGDFALDVYSASPWLAASDALWVTDFTDRFTARYGRTPSAFAMEVYTSLAMLEAAIDLAGGFVGRYDTFLDMFRSMQGLTPKGAITIDAWNNPVQDIHIRRVVRLSNGALGNQAVYTFPAVSQFWTYDPALFLALPVYDRSFNTAEYTRMTDELREAQGLPPVINEPPDYSDYESYEPETENPPDYEPEED